ncbi:cell division control protein 1-like, partial [Rutidosis leptorrhynchoides]|uniref:cell division control protein 1-like n=1 Tax=Rutidosis leptorrhynchoides TaxID=125765 RepID=UPI003A9A5F94
MKQAELTAVLCGIWVATILYGEMFAFWIPSCSKLNNEYNPDDYLKVAVIADPQVMDRTSLPLAPNSVALEIVQFYTDLYMRRAFFSSILPFKPDALLFLGDHFDGGPYLLNQEWQESYSRFKHIFGLNSEERFSDIQVYYLSGNHDIGYANMVSHYPQLVERYEKGFGIRNFRFKVGRVEFVAIDAQTVDGKLGKSTWDFIKNMSSDVQLSSRVLLTHIPLYRPDSTPCGPHRSSPIINQRISREAKNQEIRYQNYITEESSKRILDLIKPTLVLSGHDHDQCTITHESKFGSVVEHTVGTVSWQQGNLYPSFMLLSARKNLENDSSHEEA